ncbi:MAG: hypothetical protein IPK00_24335 [Deltaproteobacteria bacterium]|nr:hypothetical protein [Deltaproteobacteria bacterium]
MTSDEVARWGANTAGQPCNGSMVGSSSPVLVSGISTAAGPPPAAITAARCSRRARWKCWAPAARASWATASSRGSLTPVSVSGIDDAVAIDAGFDHACALIAGGALQCWGRGSEGQLGNGQFLGLPAPVDVVVGSERVVALGVGNTHGCAVLESGSLKCWGRNANGQLGNGTTAVGRSRRPSPSSGSRPPSPSKRASSRPARPRRWQCDLLRSQ